MGGAIIRLGKRAEFSMARNEASSGPCPELSIKPYASYSRRAILDDVLPLRTAWAVCTKTDSGTPETRPRAVLLSEPSANEKENWCENLLKSGSTIGVKTAARCSTFIVCWRSQSYVFFIELLRKIAEEDYSLSTKGRNIAESAAM